MSASIISVENLGKRYVLSHQGNRREGLRHRLEDYARSPIRWLRAALRAAAQSNGGNGALESPVSSSAPSKEEFWALKDLNFEIKRGDVVGIIGRNGAGKSTLLKILSRITEPTTGRVVIDGRVASLLEVGTGFHPELTGRENIFLNGAILGMSKVEIRKKFDEIVAFAEIEKFLDTPVKRYSSGMYVRLAFAVAAHLEPEILIVDEVLAVGDAQFQKKSLGKIKDASEHHERTVLFVSHAMDAVQRLCSSVMLLQQGSLACSGPAKEIVSLYLRDKKSQNNIIDLKNLPRDANQREGVRLLSVQLENAGASGWTVACGDKIGLLFKLHASQSVGAIDFGIGLFSSTGVEIASATSSHDQRISLSDPGTYRLILRYKNLSLVSGHYTFGVGIRSERGMEDYLRDAFSLEVISSEYSAQGKVATFAGFIIPAIEVVIAHS
jgi:lipopolysaccharide transport system ATP-binding protein